MVIEQVHSKLCIHLLYANLLACWVCLLPRIPKHKLFAANQNDTSFEAKPVLWSGRASRRDVPKHKLGEFSSASRTLSRASWTLSTAFPDALESVQDALRSVQDGLESVLDGLERVLDALGSVRDALESAQDALESARDALESVSTAVWTARRFCFGTSQSKI